MLEARVTETIRCTPEELLDFVMDPERYAEVDEKIGTIDWVRREGNVTEFRFRGALPGLPGPAPKIVSRMRLTPGERVDAGPPRIPANRLANLMAEVSASWVCEPVDGATKVTRTQRVQLKGPLKWVMEPMLSRALQPDVEVEIRQAKAYLERK